MYVNHEARLIYLAHPRTASIATATVLMARAGFDEKARAAHHQQLPADYPTDYRILTTIRNPFDAAASLWHHWNRPVPFGRTFVEWCFADREKYFPVPSLWFGLHLPPDRDRWPNLRLMRFETLQADLDRHLREAGIAPVQIPRENVGQKRAGTPYQLFWDKQSVQWFRDRFAPELSRLRYDYERLT